jgi:hypothetical protein
MDDKYLHATINVDGVVGTVYVALLAERDGGVLHEVGHTTFGPLDGPGDVARWLTRQLCLALPGRLR